MVKTIKEIEPEVFESDNYRIEYRSYSPDSPYFSYKVWDKKNDTVSKLKIGVDEESYNIDGACRLTFLQKGKEPIYLTAVRPCGAKLAGDPNYIEVSEVEKYRSEPEIGGHRPLHADGFHHYVKDVDDVMSIYRALKKGDFEIDLDKVFAYKLKHNSEELSNLRGQEQEDAYMAQKSAEKGAASEAVLSFMDAYIFSTDGAREVLAEYMHKYPLAQKEDAKMQENSDNAFMRVGKQLVKKTGKALRPKLIDKVAAKVVYNKRREGKV